MTTPAEKKNIKDYLHLYLGCEVGIPEGVGILKGVTEWAAYCELYSGVAISSVSLENVVLHLRKLSDMTEEDSIKIFGVRNKYRLFAKEMGELSLDISERFLFTPVEFSLLLREGFDLYGLIDSELAIDKGKHSVTK